MYIIRVIPIARGIGTDTLSYFTSKSVSAGALVDVPLRSKKISALVVSSELVSDIKSEIKNADFSIKKIDKIASTDFFLPEFIAAVAKTADYFATEMGSVLACLVPADVLKASADIHAPQREHPQAPENSSKHRDGIRNEKYVIQGDDDDRYTYYRSLIREEFAKKSSVFVCVPTIEDAKRARTHLEKGIEDYTYILHSGISKKNLIATWNSILANPHSVLIIATAQFLSIPRVGISTILLERENARGYKIPYRPYLDMRTFVEYYAEARGARLVMGDILLRTETLYREQHGELTQTAPFKFRSLSTASETLTDMRSYKAATGGFKIFSEGVERLIAHTHDASEHMFMLCTRRGVAPSTICGDCQNIVLCTACKSPIILHTSKDGTANFFLCHRCGERRGTDEVCAACGSWKLGTVGIGIDMVEEKLKDKFPHIKIFRIDADTTRTDKSIATTVARFIEAPGSILLGTEMALNHLPSKIDNSVIVSLDSLLSVPDFRIHEKIFYTLLKIRYTTSNTLILQTRKPDEAVLEYALKGNLSDFYRSQIEERKTFNYPPFVTLIKITLEGDKSSIISTMDAVQKTLEGYDVDVFPAFTQTARGQHVLHGLLRLPRGSWINTDLLARLRSLPPSVSIKVDPETLL